MALLEVDRLAVSFDTPDGVVQAVHALNLRLERGQTLGLVGESGSGKTQSALALLGLLETNGRASGSVRWQGRELLGLPVRELNQLRGDRLAMVFQDPMSALNPYLRVERQLTEVLQVHRGLSRRAARAAALAALEAVHIPDAAQRLAQYPHELSGGMRQRVMIAMALLCAPDLLIADEPTTALDVTVQAQIMALLRELQARHGTAILLITHDLGLVAGLCDEVMVLYGGRVMEQGAAATLYAHASHPYTRALLAAVPRLDADPQRPLLAIPGTPPQPGEASAGCPFSPRCPMAQAVCADRLPPLQTWPEQPGLMRACHFSPAEVAVYFSSAPTSAVIENNGAPA